MADSNPHQTQLNADALGNSLEKGSPTKPNDIENKSPRAGSTELSPSTKRTDIVSKPAGNKNKQLSEKERALKLIAERNAIKVQQHRKKKLLAGCEPVMGLNYEALAMDDYPENSLVAAAQNDRNYWLFLCSIFFCVFLLGLLGLFSAPVSGAAAGLLVVSYLFAFTSIRKWFFSRPPLSELLEKRKRVEFQALSHIAFLEGNDGLAWRCGKMRKYNHNLGRTMFLGVIRFSEERNLKSVLKSRKHIRLYLLFMIEAQKAYKRLQNDYLKMHFDHLDQGWDDGITDAEADKLEKEIEKNEAVNETEVDDNQD